MDSSIARIPKQWVWPIRIAATLYAVICVGFYGLALTNHYGVLQQICLTEVCGLLILRPADVQGLQELGLSLQFYAAYNVALEVVFTTTMVAIIGLLLWKASDSWVGVLAATAVAALVLGGGSADSGYLGLIFGTPGIPLIVLLFLLFPDGRFSPSFSKVFAAIYIPALLTIGLLSGAGEQELFTFSKSLWPVFNLLLMGGFGLSAIVQIYRYRKFYNTSQKQQVRWVVFGMFGLFVSVVFWFTVIASDVVPRGRAHVLINMLGLFYANFFGIGLLPYALIISILRYRLWNVDVIIRRTLQYSATSIVLGLVYFGGVTLIQSITTGLTGATSSLAVVVTTLAVAALFNPLRSRIQQIVDNRFYRRKYDAQLALEQFNEKLRDEVDLSQIRSAVVTVLDQTIQPDTVSLWLAPSDPAKRNT